MITLSFKRLIYVFAICGLTFQSVAQQSEFISITDPGQLYSGYTFSAEDKQSVISKLGESTFLAIDNACREEQWPSGISTLDKRGAVRNKIMQYHARLMANVGDKSILAIRPEDNKHMPADMVLYGTFYMVFGTSGTGLPVVESSEISITDPGELYSTYNFTLADRVKIGSAVGSSKVDKINNASHETQWPSGIATLDKRNEVRDKMKNYRISVIADLGEMSVVEVDPAQNGHMPSDMIGSYPFYMVIGNSGLGKAQPGTMTAPAGDPEEILDFPMARIIDPGQIMSTYDFEEDEMWDIIDQVGELGYDYIAEFCQEDSYPEGLSTLEKRLAARDDIMNYTAYLIAQTGDISILEVNSEDNAHMPAGLKPADTFYFVIKTAGIKVLDSQ